jgi:hypothetical protein
MAYAEHYNSISSHSIFNGWVAALDEWLCRIHVPSTTEAEKVKSYFSGHYTNVMDPMTWSFSLD